MSTLKMCAQKVLQFVCLLLWVVCLPVGVAVAKDPPIMPYAIRAVDGVLVAGPALSLRPAADIQKLWAKRWPEIYDPSFGSTSDVPVLRPDATPAQIQSARAFALEHLAEPFAFMNSVAADTAFSEFSEAQKIGFDHAWNVMPMALDILKVTGDQSDAKYLAEVLVDLPENVAFWQLADMVAGTSVRISQRLGDIKNSPAAIAWRQLLDAPETLALPRLSLALGRVGFQPAIDALIQRLAVERLPLDGKQEGSAFEIIAQNEHPAVLALSVDLVQKFDRATQAQLLDIPSDPYVAGISAFSAIYTALGYAAAFLPESERDKIAVGIPASARLNGALFEVPEDLIDLEFGISTGEYHNRSRSSIAYIPCRIYGNLEGEQRIEVEQNYVQQVSRFFEHFGDTSANARAFAAGGKQYCDVNSEALALLKYPDRNAPEFFPVWMRHGFRPPAHFLPDFDEDPDRGVFSARVLAGYEDDVIASALNDPALENIRGIIAYKIYRSVAEPSSLASFSTFIGPNDERYFLESLEIPSVMPLYVAAKVKLAPRMANGRVLFGISLDLAEGDLGGLAGLINQSAEKMQKFTADFGRELIERVVLRYQGGEAELAFLQTTAKGTHIFELSQQISSNADLYVDIYFQGVNRKWRRSFPLFASPFGYEQIQKTGRMQLVN